MFKIGIKVKCDFHKAIGIVTSINSEVHEGRYPIAVGFPNGLFDYYTKEGKIITLPVDADRIHIIEEISTNNVIGG